VRAETANTAQRRALRAATWTKPLVDLLEQAHKRVSHVVVYFLCCKLLAVLAHEQVSTAIGLISFDTDAISPFVARQPKRSLRFVGQQFRCYMFVINLVCLS
jgi:hypothetical protein